jgi:drug/metabolite transporter (DMT)-like permease
MAAKHGRGRHAQLGRAVLCLGLHDAAGLIFWYRGLALGGIARVGQLQLLQPFMGLGLAAMFLHETIAPAMLVAVGAVVGCVAGARRFA